MAFRPKPTAQEANFFRLVSQLSSHLQQSSIGFPALHDDVSSNCLPELLFNSQLNHFLFAALEPWMQRQKQRQVPRRRETRQNGRLALPLTDSQPTVLVAVTMLIFSPLEGVMPQNCNVFICQNVLSDHISRSFRHCLHRNTSVFANSCLELSSCVY